MLYMANASTTVCVQGGGRRNYLLFLLAILLSPQKKEIEALDDMFTHRIDRMNRK